MSKCPPVKYDDNGYPRRDPEPYRPRKAIVTRRIVTTVKLVARSASEAARLESQLADHLATNKPIEEFNPV